MSWWRASWCSPSPGCWPGCPAGSPPSSARPPSRWPRRSRRSGCCCCSWCCMPCCACSAAMLRLPGIAARWDAERDRRRGDVAVGRALLALAAGDKADARREAGRARAVAGRHPANPAAGRRGRSAGRPRRRGRGRVPPPGGPARCRFPRPSRPAAAGADAAGLDRGRRAGPPGRSGPSRRRSGCGASVPGWRSAPATGPRRSTSPTTTPRALPWPRARPMRSKTRRARRNWRGRRGRRTPAWRRPRWPTRPGCAPRGARRRAQAVIRHSWALAPHPDLAAFALARSPTGWRRAQAAQRLAEANPDHAESRLLLARTALDAGLTGEARHQATLARDAGLNQRRLWLLLAEIEEAEHGDTEAGRLAAPGRAAPGRRRGCRSGVALHRVPSRRMPPGIRPARPAAPPAACAGCPAGRRPTPCRRSVTPLPPAAGEVAA